MKKIQFSVLMVALITLSNIHSVHAADSPMTLDELKKVLNDNEGAGAISALIAKTSGNSGESIRAQALIDNAKSLGLQAGIAYENNRLKKIIEANSRHLDVIYDFSPLMVNERVVAPVITEARDLYNQDGDDTIRLSGVMYKIEKQAYFSSVPPNWRGYISIEDLSKSTIVNNAVAIRPKNAAEKAAWEEALDIGWDSGLEQSQKMLEYQFDELNRDFIGMLRFKKFASQGRITIPIVANERITMTRTENTIALNEQLLRLTSLPQFSTEIRNWGANESMVSSEIKPTDPRHVVMPSIDKPVAIIQQSPSFNPDLVDTAIIKTHVFSSEELSRSPEVFKNAE